MKILLLTLATLLTGALAMADDAKPLTLTVTGDAAYVLNLGGKSGDEFRKLLADAEQGTERAPEPPAVNLKVTLTNTGSKALDVWTKGDPVVLTLNLKGKGAKSIDPPIAMTQEFRLPVKTTIDAGKSVEFPVKILKSGHRGLTRYTYWTEAGAFGLTATLKTGVSPAPAGAPKLDDGFGEVTLTSAPFKITVKEK